MEIETIEDDAKTSIVKLLNEAMQVEYAFILNYPRLIYHLVNLDKIHDKQLINDLEHLGKDSSKHLGLIGQTVVELGGEPMWQIRTIPILTHLEETLPDQLERENAALLLYQQAKRVAEQNRVKTKVGGLFDRFLKGLDELPPDIAIASKIIRTLDDIIGEERHHITLVHDSIATLDMLLGK